MLVKLTTGLVMKKFKFGARPLAAWCCIADLFYILSFVAIALMNCPPLTMYGERGEEYESPAKEVMSPMTPRDFFFSQVPGDSDLGSAVEEAASFSAEINSSVASYNVDSSLHDDSGDDEVSLKKGGAVDGVKTTEKKVVSAPVGVIGGVSPDLDSKRTLFGRNRQHTVGHSMAEKALVEDEVRRTEVKGEEGGVNEEEEEEEEHEEYAYDDDFDDN